MSDLKRVLPVKQSKFFLIHKENSIFTNPHISSLPSCVMVFLQETELVNSEDVPNGLLTIRVIATPPFTMIDIDRPFVLLIPWNWTKGIFENYYKVLFDIPRSSISPFWFITLHQKPDVRAPKSAPIGDLSMHFTY